MKIKNNIKKMKYEEFKVDRWLSNEKFNDPKPVDLNDLK